MRVNGGEDFKKAQPNFSSRTVSIPYTEFMADTPIVEAPEGNMDHAKELLQQTYTNERLDLIVDYLDKMNRRDRWRTMGGALKGAISIASFVILIWSGVYFALHGQEMIKQITDATVGSLSTMNSGAAFDKYNSYIGKPK